MAKISLLKYSNRFTPVLAQTFQMVAVFDYTLLFQMVAVFDYTLLKQGLKEGLFPACSSVPSHTTGG